MPTPPLDHCPKRLQIGDPVHQLYRDVLAAGLDPFLMRHLRQRFRGHLWSERTPGRINEPFEHRVLTAMMMGYYVEYVKCRHELMKEKLESPRYRTLARQVRAFGDAFNKSRRMRPLSQKGPAHSKRDRGKERRPLDITAPTPPIAQDAGPSTENEEQA